MKWLVLQITLLAALSSSASPQMPDYIIYKGDTLVTYNLLLEKYLQAHSKQQSQQLFGLNFRDGALLTCWRGYQAIYAIDNDSLFLVDIIDCGQRKTAALNKKRSLARMTDLFHNEVINRRVYMHWISGDISFPLNHKVIRWDGVFYTIFEKETVAAIKKGKVKKIENVTNYIDDPKRVDRRNKETVSDTLFDRLKKRKWESDEFDCSCKYVITINKRGRVSNVRMHYTKEELKTLTTKREQRFCANKIMDALNKLKFDILRSKGKAIPEEVFPEMFIDDNDQIEDWTH